MKKFIAFILAVLVLSFSVIPCADDAAIFHDDDAQIAMTPSIPEDTDHNDDCSPFCICSCCAGFAITTGLTTPTAVFFIFDLNHAAIPAAKTHSLAFPVWQPPQLG